MAPMRASVPPVTYLSFDTVATGVGASQVAAYVTELARRGIQVTLHSWEPGRGDEATAGALAQVGVQWSPHSFGRHGPVGGLVRVAQGARAVRRAALVHARADLAAGAALVARSPAFVWDMRSFWADERIEQGLLRRGGPEERILRRIESAAAQRSAAIVTLSEAARPVLAQRHGTAVADKVVVIPTCADLERFAPSPLVRDSDHLRLLHLGTLNRQYDVPLLVEFLAVLRRRVQLSLTVASPSRTAWEDRLASLAQEMPVVRTSAGPDQVAALVAAHHVGLAVCRLDGMSLRAAMPTKVGELLAVGRPVVVTRGTGDLESLVRSHRCGAVLVDRSPAALEAAADELLAALDDPATPQRCRDLAAERFSLARAVDGLVELYARVAAGARP